MNDVLWGFADPILLAYTLGVGLGLRGQQRVVHSALAMVILGAAYCALAWDHPDAAEFVLAKLFDAGTILLVCMLVARNRVPQGLHERQG